VTTSARLEEPTATTGQSNYTERKALGDQVFRSFVHDLSALLKEFGFIPSSTARSRDHHEFISSRLVK
jgi:hypothetical protein